MSKQIGSTVPHAGQGALNEEQTVATIENAANSPRNDGAGNLELHEERSRDRPARATQNPATPVLSAAPNPPETRGKKPARMSRRKFFTTAGIAAASLPLGLRESVAQEVFGADSPGLDREPLVIAKQGNFFVGGKKITAPGALDTTALVPQRDDGQIFHYDHMYAEFQTPPNTRKLPLVLVHGGGGTGTVWRTTADGRDGYQSIFLRRGFTVYIVDFARRGRSGYPSFNGPFGTLSGTPLIANRTSRSGDQPAFVRWRMGPEYPNFFPNSQFPKEALDQFFTALVPAVDAGSPVVEDLVALFEKIGPAIIVTHSQSGLFGWRTAIGSPNVKGIIAYEPVVFAFPEGQEPPPIPSSPLATSVPVPRSDFLKLTQIPIQIVYGDNITTTPSPIPGMELWRVATITAGQFVSSINSQGGDASVLHLPDAGLFGNSHFSFQELNNVEVANLLSKFLHDKGLDQRGHHET